jgi:SPP1 gp7 family putative phage head morphogenesis protein
MGAAPKQRSKVKQIRRRARKNEKILRPVHPNAGIKAAYRRKLESLIEEMSDSYRHWLLAAYKRVPPAMASDAEKGSPYQKKINRRRTLASRELNAELRELGRRWERRFDDAAQRMAGWFAKSTTQRSTAALGHILRKGGWTVEFQMSKAMRDVLGATVAENVSLIKSIPQQFHTQVEGLVMRSVTAGRDLAGLTRDLEAQFAVTRRRAEFIARDQNNKATAALTRVRYVDMGVTEAIWLHSGGGKTQRPTHVKNSGKRFDIAKGWFDPAVQRYIQPGELINCRCVPKAVVKGFS